MTKIPLTDPHPLDIVRWHDADELRWAARHWAVRIGVKTPQVHLRAMTTKWASISTAGRLTLNTDLLALPKPLGEFVIVHELASPKISGWQRWPLIRRSLDVGADPAEMAYVLIFAPTGTSLEAMVEVFGARWTVEQCFEEAKGEVGLDEYEVRSWHGWYRHITLSMLSLAFLTALRASGKETILKKA